jgi:hypothetical protein
METTGKLTVIEWKKPIRLVTQLLILFIVCAAIVLLGRGADLFRQAQDPAYKYEIEREHQSQIELDRRLKAIEQRHHH